MLKPEVASQSTILLNRLVFVYVSVCSWRVAIYVLISGINYTVNTRTVFQKKVLNTFQELTYNS